MEKQMKKRALVCGAAVSAVLFVSGAAFSGGGLSASVDQLMDFDRSTGELWAIPPGQAVRAYVHTSQTAHLPADLSRFLPPDPCLPLARVWNIAVARGTNENGRAHARLFQALLGLMSDFECSATITTFKTDAPATSTTSPQPMFSIAPTAQ
jgi:hypothetical protein